MIQTTWKQLEINNEWRSSKCEYVKSTIRDSVAFNYWFGGRIQVQALSMVCESQYRGWYHTIDLKLTILNHYLEANLEDFKKLIKKKNPLCYL